MFLRFWYALFVICNRYITLASALWFWPLAVLNMQCLQYVLLYVHRCERKMSEMLNDMIKPKAKYKKVLKR